MKLTQSTLRRIIKEELTKAMSEELSDQAADIHATLRNIANWMEENRPPGTLPEEGVKAWLKLAADEGEEIPAEEQQALIDMASQIYDYM